MAQHELLVKLGLQSESFTRNLKNVNNQLKLTETEFNKLKVGADKFGSSQKDLDAKLKSLTKTKEQLTAKTILYKNKINELNTDIGKAETKHKAVTEKIEKEKNKLEELRKTQGKSSIAYKQQKEKLNTLEEQYDKTARRAENLNLSLQKQQIALNKTEAEIIQVNNAINNTKFDAMTLSAKNLGNVLATTSGKLSTLSGKLTAFGSIATATITAPIASAGGAIVKFGAEFEASMSKVKALSRATGEDFVKLENKAREMGKATSFTAKEAADGLGYMALAGWKTKEMLTGIEPVLRLAEAGNLDLATTSDLVTDSMSTLGLEVKDLTDYLDKVALSSSISNTEIDQMLKTYMQVGGSLKRFNVPLEESGALIGVLANRGIKAEQAGRSLSSIMINLTGGSGQAAKALKQLNVSAYDSKGKFKGVEAVLLELHKELNKTENGTRKYTDAQKDMYLRMIGGKTQIRTLDALLNGVAETTKKGTTEFQELKKQLKDSNGSLEQMATTMKDNVQGDWEKFTSMVGDLALEINDLLQPTIRDLLQQLTKWVEKFNNLDDDSQKFIVKIALMAASIGPLTLAAAGVTKVLALFTGGISKVISTSIKFGKTIFDVITKVKSGSSIFTALSTTIAGLPAIIGVVVAAFVAIASIVGENESALAKLQEKWGAFGEFIGGVCEMISGYVQLVFGSMFIAISTLGKVIGKVITMQWNEIDDVIAEGGSKLAQNIEKSLDNIGMSSTKAIKKIRSMTSDELNGLATDMQFILDKLPGITYDSADEMAVIFANQMSKLDNDSIQILTSTSETLNMLFRGIEEGMSNEQAVQAYTNNLRSLARTGGVSTEQLRSEIEKTLNLINNNMIDSGDRFAREAEVAMDKFSSVSSMGIDKAAGDISNHLASLSSETLTQLSGMSHSWTELFYETSLTGSMSTEEMAENIEKNLRRMAERNPQFVEQLRSDMKAYFDKLPDDADSNLLKLAESVESGTNKAVDASEGKGKKIEENLEIKTSQKTGEELEKTASTVKNKTQDVAGATGELGKDASKSFDEAFSSINSSTTEKLLAQATNIRAGGEQNRTAMQENAVDSIEGFVTSWDSNSGRINESVDRTFNNINRLTSLKWGNTTKGLSEVNKWLGLVSKKAATTKSALTPLTSLKWGNTTRGLSEVNKWLGTVRNKAITTKSALTPLTSLRWGNTTKGLSEVNKWLGTVSKSAKTTAASLRGILKVTYGSVTKGLSEVNKWLGRVKSSASSARSYLQNVASVRFGGLTKQLSEVNRWLNIVSNKASNTRYAVASVANSARSITIAQPDQDKMDILSREKIDMSGYNISRTYLNRKNAIEDGLSASFGRQKTTKEDNSNADLINMLLKQNEMLIKLINEDKEMTVHNYLVADGKVMAKATAKYMMSEINSQEKRNNRLGGVF